MKETIRLVVVLTVICAVAGILLAWVNNLTAEPIAAAQRAERVQAITKVLPPYDNEPDRSAFKTQAGGREWTFYVGRLKGEYVGAAFETTSPKGYGGNITVMAGVNAGGKIQAIEILEQKETPGLGAKIKDQDFKAGFSGRDIRTTKWAVKKDLGDIDQVTAATISSRAVTEAVKQGLGVYIENEKAIAATSQKSAQ